MIDFSDLKINRESVMRAVGCNANSPVYNSVKDEYEKYIKKVKLSPKAYVKLTDSFMGGQKAFFVLLTAGREVTELSAELMGKGEGLAGLLVDAVADECLFEMDRLIGNYIKEECAKLGMGVFKRYEAPVDMPLEMQKTILDVFPESGIGITEGLMYNPVKTMGYALVLTDDKSVFNAQHDCASCPNIDCPRRSVSNGKTKILTDYDMPEKKSGKTVMCIDIGTTTIVMQLVSDGKIVKNYSAVNAQKRFGADVISRIKASNAGRGQELKQIIRYQLVKGTNELLTDFGGRVEEVVVSGNTTMIQLLMGYSCKGMGAYPFEPENKNMIETTFSKITESNILNAKTTILPAVSAFVGGDIVSGMYMCDFDLSDKVNLFIDLGTNGEMAIGNRKKILVASTAAGPAFEGGRISCGTGSVDGAICSVDLKSGVIKTINNKKAVGICGTGIIELVSELVECNMADCTGLLDEKYFDKGYELCEDIYFTQKDMREFQMAKSAVRTGIEILIKRYGIKYEEIETVYLAGGFGYSLDVKKACIAGIVPKELLGKIKAIGNSSLGGAAKYALSGEKERIEKMRGICSEISLANDTEFNNMYIMNMNFGDIN